MIKELNAKNMIQTYKEDCPNDKDCQQALKEAFRLMRFYEFINGEELDMFYKAINKEEN